jgi:SAM-dependent methyltransferase
MSETVNSDMSEYWNGEGGKKWLRFQETMDVNLLPFGQKTMAAANILSGESVLDIGCGCGNSSIEMAGLVGAGGRVLGVDISEPILARARAQAMISANRDVEFECGDAQTVSFEAAAFDLIFSRFGVMFFDDPVAAFRNLHGALKPGGRVAFICWQPAKDNEWIKTSLETVARHVSLPKPADPEDAGPMSFGDPERVKRILTASDFSDIQIKKCDIPFTVGNTLDEAVSFLMQMGPASGAIAQSDADELTKSKFATDLRETLIAHDTGIGVTLGAATLVVTALKP